ncbi:MAG: metal-dependent hydrolase, partial [Methanomicrobiales archaeon]|nr:metal-dependent hydrolase [Methanomicrobiales archaeon]
MAGIIGTMHQTEPVDSFTHALSTFLLFLFTGNGMYAPYAIIGAVLPDIDIFFKPLSDHDPRLFIFTHGGFTHSVVGAVAVSCLAFLALGMLMISGGMGNAPVIGLTTLLFMVLGACLHLVLDALAFPGIPLLYPATARKITLGVFPGPSLLLMVITVSYLLLVASGIANLAENTFYISVCLCVIGIRTILKLYIAFTTPGTTIPTIHPLRWWVIKEEPAAYTLSSFQVGRGITGTRMFEKFKGVTEDE